MTALKPALERQKLTPEQRTELRKIAASHCICLQEAYKRLRAGLVSV